MTFRRNLILLVLVLIGSAYIWLVESKVASTAERARTAGRLFSFRSQNIEKVEIESGEKNIVCERDGEDWKIVEPIKARAENAVVERLLSNLRQLKTRATVSRQQRQARDLTVRDYGLVPPRFIVRLEGENFKRLINVGGIGPDNESLFIACDNAQENIMAVETNLLAAIPSDIGQLRSKTLFNFQTKDLRQLEIKTSEGFISLAKDENGGWVLRQPFEAKADGGRVEKLVEAMMDLQISKFLRDDAEEKSIYGFDETDTSIVFQLEGETGSRELLFGLPLSAEEELAHAGFSGEDTVFALPVAVVEALKGIHANDLRDRKLLQMSDEDVSSLRIAINDETLEFVHKEDGWEMLRPRSWEANDKLLDDLVAEWTDVYVEKFVARDDLDSQIWGLETNTTTVSFSRDVVGEDEDDSAEWIDLQVGSPPSGQDNMAAQSPDKEWAYIVSKDIMEYISEDPLFYRSREVLALEPSSIQKMTLRKGEREQVVVRGDEEDWESGDSDPDPDLSIVPQRRRMDLLESLNCRRFVERGEVNSEEYGLAEPECELTLGLSGEEGISKTLMLGSREEDGGRYATIRGQDLVFVLDEETADILCSDLYAVSEKGGDEE